MTTQKNKKLFCQIGDMVEVIHTIETNPWSGEKAETISTGARYKAVALIGWGWDLELVKGNGPKEVRILNSEMGKFVKRLKNT
jgi:hypothetical protein